MPKKVFHDLVSLKDALHLIEKIFQERRFFSEFFENISVRESLNRITAEPVFAKWSSPYFHSSAMDGYAVKAEDTFLATEKYPVKLKLGEQALWIETGDPLPNGFNAVIPVEEVNIRENYIEIYKAVPPYHHVRVIGEDIVTTELIIPEGHVIRPADIGAMLASGITEVKVFKKPILGVIPTGSELVPVETLKERALKPPELIEYNSAVLKGLIQENFSEPRIYPICEDKEEALKESLRGALKECDIVLINAGAGYGKEDLTYKVISELGEVYINGVAIKPAKPFIFGVVENKPVLGIPGYPVSTYFAFEVLVKPLINLYLRRTEEKKVLKGLLARQLPSTLGVDEFVRVKVGKVKDRYIVSPAGRGAGLLMSVVRADGYLIIPANSEGYSQGKEVEVFLWRDKKEIDNTIVCIGSHDNTLDLIYNFLRKKYPNYSFSSTHVGSMGGLVAVKKGEAHLAGTHLLDENTGEYNVSFIQKILPEKKVVLINLVYRIQGLIVKKGNPKKIKGFEDLIREDVTFINRQAGSGTRLLLDKHLKELGIDPSQIKGYEKDEYTHMGVAQAVASGRAEVGLGIYAAAKALDLDFIPVTEERYDLLIPQEFLELEMILALLEVIKNSSEFREAVLKLGGYDIRDMGKVMYEN
ncbi:MAG: molybdopterin biosynthesis protein [Thermodesulfobacteriaceae bacterium]|nr:molybdopterin biosynthesis protein [Thermodesulfobacteriaceae bacterium]